MPLLLLFTQACVWSEVWIKTILSQRHEFQFQTPKSIKYTDEKQTARSTAWLLLHTLWEMFYYSIIYSKFTTI